MDEHLFWIFMIKVVKLVIKVVQVIVKKDTSLILKTLF